MEWSKIETKLNQELLKEYKLATMKYKLFAN